MFLRLLHLVLVEEITLSFFFLLSIILIIVSTILYIEILFSREKKVPFYTIKKNVEENKKDSWSSS